MAITVVQVKPLPDLASGSFTTPTTAGNTVVVALGNGNSSNLTLTVTGVTLGGSADNFAEAETVQSGFSSGTAKVSIWVDPSCAGGQTAVALAGTNLTFGAGTGNGIVIYELAGLFSTTSMAAVRDAHTHNSGITGTSVSSGTTGTTTQPNEIAIAVLTAFQTVSSFTGAYTTTLVNDGSTVWGTGSQVLAATGTQSYAGTAAGSTVWAGAIVTLLGASSAKRIGDMRVRRPLLQSGAGCSAAGAFARLGENYD